jgi:outer membrane protein
MEFLSEYSDNINNLNNQRLSVTAKMITLIRPILSEYSDKNSISLIIDKKYIIIGKTVLDITDDILLIVDEKIGKIKLD